MKRRTKVGILVTVVAVLVVARLAAPAAVEYYLNERVLADLGDYRGTVGDIDLALWRGAVRAEDLHIEKARGADWVDFVIAPESEVFISRRALLNGALRVEAFLDSPEINFVDAEDPQDKQTGKGFNWQVIPEDILRFSLERVEVRQGQVAFRNFTTEPEVNLQAKNIDLVATNLTNIEEEEGEEVATAEFTADVLGDSPLSARAEFDPFNFRSFMLALDLTLRDLRQINDFARAYANLDFESGHGSLTTELRARDGHLSGYAKPALEDVEVFDWQEDVEEQDKNPFQVAWEGVADVVNTIFTNPESEKFATRIEISGEIPDEPDVNMWSAVFGIVRNAFAEAINTNFDNITPLDVPEAEDESEEQSE